MENNSRNSALIANRDEIRRQIASRRSAEASKREARREAQEAARTSVAQGASPTDCKAAPCQSNNARRLLQSQTTREEKLVNKGPSSGVIYNISGEGREAAENAARQARENRVAQSNGRTRGMAQAERTNGVTTYEGSNRMTFTNARQNTAAQSAQANAERPSINAIGSDRVDTAARQNREGLSQQTIDLLNQYDSGRTSRRSSQTASLGRPQEQRVTRQDNATASQIRQRLVEESRLQPNTQTASSQAYAKSSRQAGDSSRRVVRNKRKPTNYAPHPYTPKGAAGDITISGTKEVLGKEIVAGEFDFELLDETSTSIDTAQNDGSGNITFLPLSFTTAGTRTFTVQETTASSSSMTVDTTTYPVEIVTEDVNNTLVSTLSYPNGRPQFINTSVDPMKGLVEFPEIEFTAPGVYTLTIEEEPYTGTDWKSDTTQYTAEVTVTDDGYGNLVATVAYPNGYPQFTNYKVGTTGVTITASKFVAGDTTVIPDGKFLFAIYDDTGAYRGEATNDSSGNIIFPPLVFDTIGSYDFKLVEITPSGDGWTTDSTEYDFTVDVTDIGNGDIQADYTFAAGPPEFTNTYTLNPVEVIINASKTVVGASLVAGAFEFALLDDTGTEVATATNEAPMP